jgi:hypothetical protein
MTPEDKQTIKTHARAIAAILYQNTDSEKLQSIEDIELTVRDHVLESVSPEIGIFLSKQRLKPQQANPESSKA